MDFKYLGSTGFKVSEFALGTMTWGKQIKEQADAHRSLSMALIAGINMIDTADVYNSGVAELMLGNWIKDNTYERHDLIITTKFGCQQGTERNASGWNSKHAMSVLDAQLKRLQTNYVDILYAHLWDTKTPMDELVAFAQQAMRAGKIRWLGVSNWHAWQMERLAGNVPIFKVCQVLYNMVARDADHEILPWAKYRDVGVIAYSPLAGGILAKPRVMEELPKRWLPYASIIDQDAWTAIRDTLDVQAKRFNVSRAAVALAWQRSQHNIASSVLGFSSVDQLAFQLEYEKVDLTGLEIIALDKLGKGRAMYPEWMIAQQNAKRV